LIDTDKSVSE